MANGPQPLATLRDLHAVEGRAELIGGRIVRLASMGYDPGRASLAIAMSLHRYAKQVGRGQAAAGGLGYALTAPLRNRRLSFQPDASYHDDGSPADSMDFAVGPPHFAVAIRRGDDLDLAARRSDYFEAGTLVVWDVDTTAATIAVYRGATPDPDAVYGAGMVAEAEPAVPGWRCPVREIFAA